MDLLQVRGLRAGYGKAEVLSGLDLKLPQGSVVTVIGPGSIEVALGGDRYRLPATVKGAAAPGS